MEQCAGRQKEPNQESSRFIDVTVEESTYPVIKTVFRVSVDFEVVAMACAWKL